MHCLRSQFLLKEQFFCKAVDKTGRNAHREAAAKLGFDMFYQCGIIFNIGRLLHLGLSQSQPLIAVKRKTTAGICARNRLPTDQSCFALGYFFLGFPISLSIAEAIFDFAGKLVSFDIARLPSAVLPFENVFAFCNFDTLLVF